MTMSFEDYLGSPGISSSFLKACSVGHYQGWKYLHDPKPTTDAMVFGTAVHCAILEPENFSKNYAFMEKVDLRTKDGKAYATEFMALNAGKIVLDTNDQYKIEKIVQKCKAIEIVNKALTSFDKEKNYFWESFKARLDLVNEQDGVIIDIKTTRDASAREFVKQILSLRYNLSLMHYSHAIGKPATCYLIAIESETTEVALYDVTDIVHSEYTNKQYEKALITAQEVLCLKDCPPKFLPEIVNLTLPDWALAEAVL